MSTATPPRSVPELVSLSDLGRGCYESNRNAELNAGGRGSSTVAFGGCTMAFAVNAAWATMKPGSAFNLYSAMGHFVNPASPDFKLLAEVVPIRDSKTFATRQIHVKQKGADGKERIVLVMLVDFQLPEERPLLAYSVLPSMNYSPATESWDDEKLKEHGRRQPGGLSKLMEKALDQSYTGPKKYFGRLLPPEGFAAQTLAGLMAQWPTTQDHLDTTEKTTASWIRTKAKMETFKDNCVSLTYILDAGMPIIPPAFTRLNLKEVGALSSLDFAIRIFANDFSLHDGWHLREEKTITGREGRTFQEARVFSPHGHLVASMTQQCMLRGKAPQAAKI